MFISSPGLLGSVFGVYSSHCDPCLLVFISGVKKAFAGIEEERRQRGCAAAKLSKVASSRDLDGDQYRSRLGSLCIDPNF